MFDAMNPIEKSRLRIDEPRSTLLGREKIRAAATQYSLSWILDRKKPFKSCKNRSCARVLKDIKMECSKEDELATIRYALSSPYVFKPNFCENCFTGMKQKHSAGRDRLWDDFAKIFGLTTEPVVWSAEDWESDTE